MSNRRRLLLHPAITTIGEPVRGNNSSGEKGAGASMNGASITGSGVAGMMMKMIEPGTNASVELQPRKAKNAGMKHRAISKAVVGTLFCVVSSAFSAANVDIDVPGVAPAESSPYVTSRPVYVVVPSSRYSPYRGESEQREEYWRERQWHEQEEHSVRNTANTGTKADTAPKSEEKPARL